MLVRLKNTNREFHLPPDIAKALMLSGLIEDIPPQPHRPLTPMTTWSCGFVEGMLGRSILRIKARCENCGQSITMEGPSVHKTGTFSHCGANEHPPDHIVKRYTKLLPQVKAAQPRPEESAAPFRRLYEADGGKVDYVGSNPMKE
jgi:hypothetical protein